MAMQQNSQPGMPQQEQEKEASKKVDGSEAQPDPKAEQPLAGIDQQQQNLL